MTSQFWLEQYHTTIDKRNAGYTEVVDNVPTSEIMLYYFIYVITSQRDTFQMSGNTEISVRTNITPLVGNSDMLSSCKISIIWIIISSMHHCGLFWKKGKHNHLYVYYTFVLLITHTPYIYIRILSELFHIYCKHIMC